MTGKCVGGCLVCMWMRERKHADVLYACTLLLLLLMMMMMTGLALGLERTRGPQPTTSTYTQTLALGPRHREIRPDPA